MSIVRPDALSYTSHARLRILLAPLRPLKQSRFEALANLVRLVTDVRLEDLKVTTAKDYNHFDPRRLPAGRILFEYVSEPDRDHSYLESFEASRQVFAILLIGDGSESHDNKDVESQINDMKSFVSSAVLVQSLLFGRADTVVDEDWPSVVQGIHFDDNFNTMPTPALRDALVNVASALLASMNDLYLITRDRANITSPYDPASVLIRPQPQRMSSFALGDSQVVPASSPTPGQDKQLRNSLGPGILTSSDRLKVVSNGRAAKLCGDLLLICGFCNEALKTYTEAAAIARANNDHLWQGAALEGIGICLVLFAFLDMSFQVPPIAQVTSGSNISSKKTEQRNSTSSSRGEVDLLDYLPNLHASVLNLYQKSTSSQSDQIPAFVLSESTLRLANLLAKAHMAGGLNRRALDHIVLGIETPTTGQQIAAYPPRAEIAAWAMRAYQGPIQSLSVSDKVHVLSGLASVHGAIGFIRRRALFLREILLALIPALVQARVAGAAGMGIHPAASLALSDSQTNNFSREVLLRTQQTGDSLASLLEDVAQSYGVPEADHELDVFQAVLGGYGWSGLRNATLKDCMSMCESIPDFKGVLRFSARILGFNSSALARDEQVRLVANIPRVTAIARRTGLLNIDIEYWDHFLVRKIEVLTKLSSLPIKRDTGDLDVFKASPTFKNDPFLYNPYERKSITTLQPTLVQSESTDILVTLQNPFLFDVEALDVELMTSDPSLKCSRTSAYIKASSTTTVSITCKATVPGTHRILGCRVQMSGCRKSSFFLRHAPSRSEIEAWHVANGGLFRPKRSGWTARTRLNTESEESEQFSTPDVVVVDVLQQAPVLSYKHGIATDSLGLAVLEGETSTLDIILENTSNIPINFLAFSISDSTEKSLLQAINSRTKQPHEIYELETFLYKRKALTFNHKTNPTHIPPNSSGTFSIDVYGKRGIATAQVIVSYGNVQGVHDHSDSTAADKHVPREIYTRHITIPVKCIVHHSVEFIHCDILPFSIPDVAPHIPRNSSQKYNDLLNSIPPGEHDLYHIMVLDIRNAQPQSSRVDLTFSNGDATFTTQVDIAGTSQERILIPLRRALLSRDHLSKSIPSLSERQFVVSSVSREVEAMEREMYWSREDFLARLLATWSCGTRSGVLELRSIYFTKRMVENYLLPPLRINVQSQHDNGDAQRVFCQTTLRIKIVNHAEAPESSRMMLRVLATHQVTHEIASQFLILGSNSIALTVGTGTTTHQLQCCPLSAGKYNVQASLAHILSQDKIIALSPKLEIEVIE